MSEARGAGQSTGSGQRTNSRWRQWGPLAVGLVLALGLLELGRSLAYIKFDEAALGVNTRNFYEAGLGQRVLCQNNNDSKRCAQAFQTAGRGRDTILWLGNSQLPAINQPKPNDLPAPIVLHQSLAGRGKYLVTYAQPNANLHEHGTVFTALEPIYRPKLVILPVFFDDIREMGIRPPIAELLDDPVSRASAEKSALWPHISKLAAKPDVGPAAHKEPETLQTRVEEGLNQKLGAIWPLWRQRTAIRGVFAFAVHTARNKILGISSQTKRTVDPTVYAEKMVAFDALLRTARDRGVKVLVYIPPYRRDISGPYIERDYQAFKMDLQKRTAALDASYLDIEGVVPGPEWGTVRDAIFKTEQPDFMHFTGEGHRRHAQALDAVLKQMGF